MLYPNLQSSLFQYKFKDSGCTLHQADLLFNDGLLSFSPEKKDDYQQYEIEELKFLKCLYFDSSLPTTLVKVMLSKLAKPYSFSFDKIYWDYGNEEWKELPQDIDDYIENNFKEIIFEKFDEFLEEVEEDDLEDLILLSDAAVNKVKELKKVNKNMK